MSEVFDAASAGFWGYLPSLCIFLSPHTDMFFPHSHRRVCQPFSFLFSPSSGVSCPNTHQQPRRAARARDRGRFCCFAREKGMSFLRALFSHQATEQGANTRGSRRLFLFGRRPRTKQQWRRAHVADDTYHLKQHRLGGGECSGVSRALVVFWGLFRVLLFPSSVVRARERSAPVARFQGSFFFLSAVRCWCLLFGFGFGLACLTEWPPALCK